MACAVCNSHDRTKLNKVAAETERFFFGKAIETRTRYVCPKCGATWVHTSESGLGGHGSFWDEEPHDNKEP